jgi:anti-sigma factor RsiW
MTSSRDLNVSSLMIHAYVDGELDPVDVIEVARRLDEDPSLAAERDRVVALRRLIGEHLRVEALPESLRERIERTIGPRRRSHPSWAMVAAAALVAAILTGGAGWLMLRADRAAAFAELTVASHVRALMAQQPTDVSSSDRHTVKPWFNGRIARAPQVFDLTDKGFPLVGGRVDVVGSTPGATLVYRHRQHLISLIAIPPNAGAGLPGRWFIGGHHVVSWRTHQATYWAVSDLGAGDLDAFARAFQTADGHP